MRAFLIFSSLAMSRSWDRGWTRSDGTTFSICPSSTYQNTRVSLSWVRECTRSIRRPESRSRGDKQ